MPRAKQRRGLLPTTAIGAPFRPPPSLRIPESLTARGDKSGRAYFRFGEDGEETVDIRGSGQTSTVGGVVQAAGGLTATVDPYARRRQRAQTRLGQVQQLQGARRNFGNLEDIGKRRTLQASEDTAYGQLGVAGPADIDVPLGSNPNFASPLARASLRTNEQLLGEQFNEQNALQSAQDELFDANEAGRGLMSGAVARPSIGGRTRGGIGATAAPARRASLGAKSPGGTIEYVQDPETGKTYEVDPEKAPEFRQKLQERGASRRGNVLYEDPFNPGAREEVSPAEAAIRKQRDSARTKQEYERRYEPAESPYATFSRSELMDYAVDGAIEGPDLVKEFRARGLGEGEIIVMMKAIAAERKKKAGTAIKYPQGFGDE